MPNYYLYRISSDYDGFRPSRIPERAQRGVFSYNWRAYVQNLERGDIVLTYFTGSGCRAGVYAVTVVRSADVTIRSGNVKGRILVYSADDRHPLIRVDADKDLFDRIRTRIRGAELIVPDDCESRLYELLTGVNGLLTAASKRNVILPGAEPHRVARLDMVPLINTESDFSTGLAGKQLICAYWIRPSQASWIAEAPPWLSYVSGVFGKFKSGDLSRIRKLGGALARQIRAAARNPANAFGVILGVPLNEQKRSDGEVDRVAELAKAVSQQIGVPVSDALRIEGNVSRRLYKLSGKTSGSFRADYLAGLKIRHTSALTECIRAGKEILLVDDVYTDGLTTATIAEALRGEFRGADVRVRTATLGVMAKHKNMDDDLIGSWR